MSIIYILLALLLTLPIAGIRFYKKENLPGLALCLAIAIPDRKSVV